MILTLLESLNILVSSILIKLKVNPRKAFLILALEYISLQQILAFFIGSKISSAYDKMLLS